MQLHYTTPLPLLQWAPASAAAAADARGAGSGGRATPSRLRHSALPDAIRSMPEAIAAAAAVVVTYKCVRP